MPTPRVQAAAEGMPKFPGYEAAFSSLENPINRARKFAKVLRFLAEMSDEGGAGGFDEEIRSAMALMGHELFQIVDALDHQFLDLHNEAQLAESSADKGAGR